MSTALVVRRQQCTLLDMWSKIGGGVWNGPKKSGNNNPHTAQVWDQARPSKYQKVPKDTQLEIVKTIVSSHCLTIPEFLHSSPLVRQFILPATTIRTWRAHDNIELCAAGKGDQLQMGRHTTDEPRAPLLTVQPPHLPQPFPQLPHLLHRLQ
ncbi:hypothetical protein Pelo_14293 [Pelomyxa schiedti]|nr:hypothetical protein Pelo_14293 [Pelomyxa schiedti]